VDKNEGISVRRQCELLKVCRSMVYYLPKGESEGNLRLMREIDELHMEDPTAGSRRMRSYLKRRGFGTIARSRVSRLMKLMGVEAVYPRKRTTIAGGRAGIHPYRLKGRWLDNVVIERFWRSIKYEDIYLKSYENAWELERGGEAYIMRYNLERPHQSLEEATPEEVYEGAVRLAA